MTCLTDPKKGKAWKWTLAQELGPVDEEVNNSQRSSRSLEMSDKRLFPPKTVALENLVLTFSLASSVLSG